MRLPWRELVEAYDRESPTAGVRLRACLFNIIVKVAFEPNFRHSGALFPAAEPSRGVQLRSGDMRAWPSLTSCGPRHCVVYYYYMFFLVLYVYLFCAISLNQLALPKPLPITKTLTYLAL